MSIENFLEAHHPSDPDFVADMSRRPGYGSLSPVIFLADIYRSEGRDGARAYSSGGTMERTDLPLSQYPAPLIRNLAAIHLGVTLRAIDEILATSTFDQLTYTSFLKESMVGVGWVPAVPEYPVVEQAGRWNWDEMNRVQKDDKTFTRFFLGSDIYVLPKSLQELIKRSRLLQNIRYLLDGYKDRATILIDARKKDKPNTA